MFGKYGAEGPLILHDPEDRDALNSLNEYGDCRLFAILQGRDLALTWPSEEPRTPSLCRRAHSALLRSMAQAATVQGFDAARQCAWHRPPGRRYRARRVDRARGRSISHPAAVSRASGGGRGPRRGELRRRRLVGRNGWPNP